MNKGEEIDAPLDIIPIHTRGGSIIVVQVNNFKEKFLISFDFDDY